MVISIGPRDEVITTAYSFFATARVIARLGARPVFVDIDPNTFNLDSAQVGQRITTRTKAIIPVHLFGQCAAMDPIMEAVKAKAIHAIQDAAQAIGARDRKGRVITNDWDDHYGIKT
jgi:dTDP-4-amino-4,6-dideoxygalactose transaminase